MSLKNKRFKTYLEVQEILEEETEKEYYTEYYQKELENIILSEGLNIENISVSRYDNNVILHIHTSNSLSEIHDKRSKVEDLIRSVIGDGYDNYFFTLS